MAPFKMQAIHTVSKVQLSVQLTLESHRFELSTYTWIFINKYSWPLMALAFALVDLASYEWKTLLSHS